MSASRRRLGAVLACLACAAVPAAARADTPSPRDLAPGTRLFIPAPDPGGLAQVEQLFAAGRVRDAALVGREITTPQAVWFTKGTRKEVRASVRATMRQARAQKSVPTLVAYDLPYRDCGQYSSGGAADAAAYARWIDGFARGIGNRRAIVILEPDGLGLIPQTITDGVPSCNGPQGGGTTGAANTRFAEIRGAVERLERQPRTRVYLDGTHSGWLGVGDIAERLSRAGVADAQGFFLNVSNYQPTEQLEHYGTWISKCLAYAANGGAYGDCASQYYPATASDPSTWGLSDQWYAEHVDAAGLTPTAHFVIDTSRNGQGPWAPAAGTSYPDPQTWCNPPGRGLGTRPTTDTGVALLDALLWIKTPGQSDGSCNRGIAGSTTDPEWGGIVDPAAGAWFPRQALQLARLADPPLLP